MPQKQEIPKSLLELLEELAENIHNAWMEARIKEGWVLGKQRNEIKMTHPCLTPYKQLLESEKEYDRNTALQTIHFIINAGYEIKKQPNKIKNDFFYLD